MAEVTAEELRALAAAHMRGERPSHTLQPTALAHEAWLRLSNGLDKPIESPGAFLSLASKVMRNILVDHARRRGAQRRGSGRVRRLGEDDRDVPVSQGLDPTDLLALEDALERLEREHPRAATVVELRFFGGASFPQIADATGWAQRTVEKDWAVARAWLRGVLDGERSCADI
ncbi:MAG: ECF-type sigma factor [Phycisphaerales bacterium JB043]